MLKDFVPPPDVGGPDIRRRVLIAPAVASRVWSGTQEVDVYGSTFVNSPTQGKYIQLDDGRILKLRLASNGLRMQAKEWSHHAGCERASREPRDARQSSHYRAQDGRHGT